MEKFIAAIDQGTTSTRCMIFNHDGVVAVAQKEHRQIFPKPGWVEHDPLELWQRTQEVVAEAVKIANAKPGDIAGIGITNQRETTVVWDKRTGRPLCNAIVWQDTRTKQICDQLAQGDLNRFREKVGLPLATYFSGPKLQWTIDNVPGAHDAMQNGTALAGTIDSWLIWNLTGGAHVIDVTNASRTMLMNLRTLEWDEEMLEVFGIPRVALPTIVSSSDPDGYGKTLRDGPFADAIPVCASLGDQQAALVGQTCFARGSSKNTYGTGCFMLLNTGHEIVTSRHGLLTTVAYRLGNEPAEYALEGSIAVAGALIQWLRDKLQIIGSSKEVEPLARTVEDNGGVYLVPAFSGLFAPYWRSDARGVITGLTGFAGKAHIARAALESTAYQTLDVLKAMQSDSGAPLNILRVDGGMTANDLLMQFQADILNVPVQRPAMIETTVLGAAYAAGLATGFWSDRISLCAAWLADKTWEPRMSEDQRQSLYAQWKKAVERSMGWVDAAAF